MSGWKGTGIRKAHAMRGTTVTGRGHRMPARIGLRRITQTGVITKATGKDVTAATITTTAGIGRETATGAGGIAIIDWIVTIDGNTAA
jgi:hypothetical protein